MKKLLALILCLAVSLPLLLSCESGTQADTGTVTDSNTVTTEGTDPASADPLTEIFVSPDGDSKNADGSYENPYGSLQAAQKAVRLMKKKTDKPITVWLRGGDYLFTQTVNFGGIDAGTEDAPITYAAWNGEEVRFIGGVKVDPSLISSAADSGIAKRMLDSSKAKDLLVIDMSTLCPNGSSLPDFWCNYPGHLHWDYTRGDIYIGDAGLKRARWPNDGYATSDKTLEMTKVAHRNNDADPDNPEKPLQQDSSSYYLDPSVTERVKQWDPSYINDVYIYGYFTNNYTHETVRPYELNTETGEMKLRTFRHPYDYEIKVNRMYFLNVPEEIDLPGESYVDYENNKIYFLPTENYDENDVWYSKLGENMITLQDTHDITFRGISFLYTRSTPIESKASDGITLDTCKVAYTDLYGALLDGNRTVIKNCEFYDTGLACVRLTGGGDPITLTSSECVIENCIMHDTSRSLFNQEHWAKDAQFVFTECVGTQIRNNLFYNSVMEGIRCAASNCVIEYNEFHDVNTECGDFGAIYFGGSGTTWGTEIRYNSFRNIGNDMADWGSHCIYFDGGMAAEIYGNLFYDACGKTDSQQGVIKFGTTQCGYVHDNVFVDCWEEVWNAQSLDPNSDWILIVAGLHKEMYTELYDGLKEIGFDSEYYHAYYDGTNTARIYEYIDLERIDYWHTLAPKDLMKMIRDGEVKAPSKTNILENNIFVNYNLVVRSYDLDERANYYDQTAEDTSIFVDYEGKDFRLTEEGLAKVRESIPEFNDVPYDKIGIFEGTH